jgi:hypothetical protein
MQMTLEPSINRNQIIRAVDLEAVAGIVDDRDVCIGRLVGEIARRPPRFQRREIVSRIDPTFSERMLPANRS